MSQIVPDDKDWTFVLQEKCNECGAEVSGVSVNSVVAQLPEVVQRYRSVLDRPNARTRSSATRWSDQEYVVHVAEMFEIMSGRLDLMLDQHEPTFPNWDQDVAADQGNYNTLSTSQAVDKLQAAAQTYGGKLANIAPEKYSRKGMRSNGSAFTVESLTQYAWHDVVHHLRDLKA
ncbi:DinB family protein [Glutamicibacter sp. NPDC087344]|uniref:DinB family protein n=1 Tax=Glutamicibacter sp. NPDC087344 TaxID=3363994 RepID=UPI00381C9BD2